jgi:hypothetical protein
VPDDDRHRFLPEFAPSADSPEIFPFDAGAVVPGRYQLEVNPPSWVATIEVPPTGRRDLEIAVPPPANVRVRLVDAETAIAVTRITLWWHIVIGEPLAASGGFVLDDGDGEFEFRAPAGRVQLEIGGDHNHVETIELHPGDNEITLRARRSYAASIVFKERGAWVACPPDLQRRITVEAIDGEGRGREHGSGRMLTHLVVDQPGRYRVTVPALDGYEPIAPFEIVIAASAPNEHVVELVKKR